MRKGMREVNIGKNSMLCHEKPRVIGLQSGAVCLAVATCLMVALPHGRGVCFSRLSTYGYCELRTVLKRDCDPSLEMLQIVTDKEK